MGRTLFYKFYRNPAIKVTDSDWERIDKLTNYFRTKFRWSCETVGFYTLDFHPRWREWFPDSKLPSDQKGWEFVNTAYEELKQKGLSRLKIIRRLHRQKLIDYDGANGLDLQSALGSTKVAGNECNAFLVAAWLVEVSKLLPHHKFELRDEGRFLKVALMLQNGLAKPDLDYVRHTIRYIENKPPYTPPTALAPAGCACHPFIFHPSNTTHSAHFSVSLAKSQLRHRYRVTTPICLQGLAHAILANLKYRFDFNRMPTMTRWKAMKERTLKKARL